MLDCGNQPPATCHNRSSQILTKISLPSLRIHLVLKTLTISCIFLPTIKLLCVTQNILPVVFYCAQMGKVAKENEPQENPNMIAGTAISEFSEHEISAFERCTPAFVGSDTPDTEASKHLSENDLEVDKLQDIPESQVMTARSVLIGLLTGALGAAVALLFSFKPVYGRLSPSFLQIVSIIVGRGVALIPGPRWWNPGPFSIKEGVLATLIAISASTIAFGAEAIAVNELYFDKPTSFGVSVGILISSQFLGFAWAGLLQPILIYPARTCFPEILPSVTLFHSLFKVGSEASDQISFFKKAFFAIGIYEILPTYIMPAFQAINAFCLTLPKNQLITNVFGGAQPFEGLGFLSFSADWSMVSTYGPLFTPASTQIHHVLAVLFSLFLFSLAYSRSWYGSGINQNFPFMSADLFLSNGTAYPYQKAINKDGTPNEEFIKQAGLPFFTSTYLLVEILTSVGLTCSIMHVVIKNYDIIGGIINKKKSLAGIDPHRVACQKYSDFPAWGFAAISVSSISLTFALSSISNSGISILGLICALFFSLLWTLAIGFIVATTGFAMRVSDGIQMFGALLFPGNIFGSMWFTIYGASTCLRAIDITRNLKLGQSMHLPQRTVVFSQLLGSTVGAVVNLVVMRAILANEHEVLLSPHGNGIFSGAEVNAFHARSVSWGIFSRRLFLSGQRYSAISLAFLMGIVIPIPLFIASRQWPKYKFFSAVNIPLLTGIMVKSYISVYGGHFTCFVIGFLSQFWARKYHHVWFRKYNYILSASLDGGTSLMILFLSMVFQGGDGHKINFPTYFLNPAPPTPRDYCYIASRSA